MLLERKTAVVYGGGGTIGGAIAKALAVEGARVFLAGLKPPELEGTAEDVRGAGGHAETAVVDVLDEAAVVDHTNAVAAIAGRLDICVNVCSHEDVRQPLTDLPATELERSVGRLVTAHLLTTKAAARHMIKQGSGVILHLGGGDSTNSGPGVGSGQVGAEALEALRRQWAYDLGGHGIRVVSLRTGGVAEASTASPDPAAPSRAFADRALLARGVTPADIGRVAAFVASDQARAIISTQINLSFGAPVD